MNVQFEEDKYVNYRGSQSGESDFVSRFLIKIGLVDDTQKAKKGAFVFVLVLLIFSTVIFISSFGSGYEETTEESDYYVPAE